MLPRLLLVLLATTWAVDPRPILGAVVHARGPVHAMNRTELQAELDERGARRLESDSDDELRMRLYHARTELLEQRTKVVMQAEAIMQEVHQHGDERFLASWSLDSVLSDDNAIFMNAMGLRMLESLKFQAIVGACVGVVLAWLAPLGRLPRRMLLPNFAASPTLQTVAVVAGGGVTFGALQLLLKFVRRLLGAQSLFCQKLAAVTCRDAAIEWMLEKEKRPTFAGGATSASASASAAVADLPLVPLWRRRGVIVPVIILATGSSIFEEVVFRGILLHGLVSKARWPAALATTLTSLAFGLMHIRNEASSPRLIPSDAFRCLLMHLHNEPSQPPLPSIRPPFALPSPSRRPSPPGEPAAFVSLRGLDLRRRSRLLGGLPRHARRPRRAHPTPLRVCLALNPNPAPSYSTLGARRTTRHRRTATAPPPLHLPVAQTVLPAACLTPASALPSLLSPSTASALPAG